MNKLPMKACESNEAIRMNGKARSGHELLVPFLCGIIVASAGWYVGYPDKELPPVHQPPQTTLTAGALIDSMGPFKQIHPLSIGKPMPLPTVSGGRQMKASMTESVEDRKLQSIDNWPAPGTFEDLPMPGPGEDPIPGRAEDLPMPVAMDAADFPVPSTGENSTPLGTVHAGIYEDY